ncbi:hypothetical protein F4777DRAFT_557102 [Nemania sp. FL0916]|nr:hypothetical protein F4777DRAFT_557102 [Nemania sp. FL0916]
MAEPIDLVERNPYLQYLKSKDKYASWMKCLAKERCIIMASTISILDIAANGESKRWTSDNEENNLSKELEAHELECGTRLIAFVPWSRCNIQDHAGIMYDVEPGFFRAVLHNCGNQGVHSYFRVPEFLVGGRPQYLDLGYGWAAVIIHCNANQNIVLLCFPLAQRVMFSGVEPQIEGYIDALLERDKIFLTEAHEDPLLLLLPILELHASSLYEHLILAERSIRLGISDRKKHPSRIEEAWHTLRMIEHDGMMPLKCIQYYIRNNNLSRIERSNEYMNLVERFACIEKQISHTLRLALEYVQHHTSLAALEESRASIEQAGVAIEESRRTKLITVLAIFFVPISLSTSIFGMNIHELNASGQSLWVFIVTTVAIVAVTMIAWGFLYQVQKYESLLKASNSRVSEHRHWRSRLLRLLFLVSRGHTIWAWKSGILFSLFTDGRVRFLRSCDRELGRDGVHNPQNPCSYIMNLECHGDDGFDSWRLENLPAR